MQTIDTLHHRALMACRGAELRALQSESFRLAGIAGQVHDSAERAYARRDAGLLQRAISTAASIGRRVRRAGGL